MSNIITKADNLTYMKTLPSESFDFIYIDPPFFSDAKYYTRKKNMAYSDIWDNLESYLSMLSPRIAEMRRLLKNTGLLAIHLDWHAVHYVKVETDKLFGRENFINEVIWAYKSGGASGRHFARKHDNILLYAKTSSYYFSPQKEKSYNRDMKPYKFSGVEEFEDEKGWYTLVNQKDVFNVDMVGRSSSERTGYATQKPEALLTLLICSLCPERGRVGDFFAGSGTAGVAAAKLGREFVLCDSGEEAVRICKSRFDRLGISYEEV